MPNADPMTRISHGILIAILLVATQSACGKNPIRLEPAGESEIGSQADCIPRFPDAAGWFGGDAAYSIPLPSRLSERGARTSLWLFGDTFVERPESSDRRAYPFVHNTIGLSRCRGPGAWSLETFWKGRRDDSPRAFFAPDPDAEWVREAIAESRQAPYYWLFDGFIAHDRLFVGLLRVVPWKARGPFNLPFRLAGMDLARIENPRDPPERWRVQVSTLSDDPVAFPGSTFVVEGDHLYAFAFLDRDDGRSPRVLTRIHLRHLRSWRPDLSEDLETLVPGGRWEKGIDPDHAQILMADDATEMSVHYDPSLERWLAVYTAPIPPRERFSPSVIRIRSATALEGPWSSPRDLYAIPETRPGADGQRDENLFCYAAKAHPQFARTGSLLVTYVCNLFARNEAEIVPVLERLAKSPDLYRAIAVSLRIPAMREEISTDDEENSTSTTWDESDGSFSTDTTSSRTQPGSSGRAVLRSR